MNILALALCMVKSEQYGNMVIGKGGFRYLDDGKVEGVDPLLPYGPNAIRHLRREASFTNCPDMLVNAVYDPETQLACRFRKPGQPSRRDGRSPELCLCSSPGHLSAGDEPIVTAVGLHNVLRGWRDQAGGKA